MKPRRGRAQRPNPPTAVVVAYQRLLRPLLSTVADAAIAEITRKPSPRFALTDASPYVVSRIQYLERVGKEENGRIRKALETFWSATDRHNARELKRVAGIDARALRLPVGSWVDRNVALIQSVQGEQLDDIRSILDEAEIKGAHPSEISKQIQERTGVAQSRADLIARDQVLKLNATMTKSRQTAAGIDRYRWSTSQDDRVRPDHEELNGQIFYWNDPPDTGNGNNHPGEDFQCRCVAVPILDVLEEDE